MKFSHLSSMIVPDWTQYFPSVNVQPLRYEFCTKSTFAQQLVHRPELWGVMIQKAVQSLMNSASPASSPEPMHKVLHPQLLLQSQWMWHLRIWHGTFRRWTAYTQGRCLGMCSMCSGKKSAMLTMYNQIKFNVAGWWCRISLQLSRFNIVILWRSIRNVDTIWTLCRRLRVRMFMDYILHLDFSVSCICQ